jgi:hypothetical protein
VTTRIAEIIAANSKLGIRGIRAELERRWGLDVKKWKVESLLRAAGQPVSEKTP